MADAIFFICYNRNLLVEAGMKLQKMHLACPLVTDMCNQSVT